MNEILSCERCGYNKLKNKISIVWKLKFTCYEQTVIEFKGEEYRLDWKERRKRMKNETFGLMFEPNI